MSSNSTTQQTDCPGIASWAPSDPRFLKDIYPPKYFAWPAISYVVLSIVFLVQAIFAVKNIRNIILGWNERNKDSSVVNIVMNVLVLFNIIALFGYMFDGPIQLISEDSGESITLNLLLEILSICFENGKLAFCSYVWIQFILIYERMIKNVWLKYLIKVFFILDGIVIMTLAVFNIFTLGPGATAEAEQLYPLFLSLLTLVNGLIFAASCYKLGLNLKSYYNLEKYKAFQTLAIIVGFTAFFRVANDFSNYVAPNWQLDTNINSYCRGNMVWTVYIFFYSIIVDVTPTTFFLLVFRQEVKPRLNQYLETLTPSSHLQSHLQTHLQKTLSQTHPGLVT